MKLISLNVQCGVNYEPLVEFIKRQSSEIDIFCFQEVFHDTTKMRPLLGNKARPKLFSEIQNILQDFNGYHFPTQEGDFGGLAIFIKKSFAVNKVSNDIFFQNLNIMINENDENYFSMGRNLQSVKFSHSGKEYTVFNFHGMWIANGKEDTEKRILQSKEIRKIFDKSRGAKILCTDLNVEPNTKSVTILNEGNKNLIQEFKTISTRSVSKNRSEIVDYVIVSPEVEVKNFEVLKDEVSDHLPLFLEFN